VKYIVDKMTGENCVILLTYMNGDDIHTEFKKTPKSDTLDLVEDGFSIRRDYNKISKSGFGNKISVYIDSIGDSDEYLVSPKLLKNTFKKLGGDLKFREGNLMEFFEEWSGEFKKKYTDNYAKVSRLHNYMLISN
jgi:hypothetical protein